MTSEQNMVFEVAGEGVPVLLVHGLGGTANVWAGQAGILACHFKVVRPDLPGSGRSPFSGTLSTGSLVAALHALLDSNALGAVHLVGHSYGSIVCQHFAAQHPQSVRSLALMGAFAAPPDPVRGVLRERAERHFIACPCGPSGGGGIRARARDAPGSGRLRCDLRSNRRDRGGRPRRRAGAGLRDDRRLGRHVAAGRRCRHRARHSRRALHRGRALRPLDPDRAGRGGGPRPNRFPVRRCGRRLARAPS